MQQHDCKIELRESDLRATPARLAVLSLLEKSVKPVDVTTIIGYLNKKNIKVDPVTAFRIVNVFTDKGLTKKVQLQEGKFRYELSSQTDHHHLICRKCGDIEDISDCNIDVLEKEIERKKGFNVQSHSLEFFGICKACRH